MKVGKKSAFVEIKTLVGQELGIPPLQKTQGWGTRLSLVLGWGKRGPSRSTTRKSWWWRFVHPRH